MDTRNGRKWCLRVNSACCTVHNGCAITWVMVLNGAEDVDSLCVGKDDHMGPLDKIVGAN